jgi:DNA-binding response OmpR family regulator
MEPRLKVLIVEDELLIADMIEETLRQEGFIVCGIATNIARALTLAADHKPELAVVDVRLEGNDLGTTLAVELKNTYQIGILYATGNSEMVIRQGIAGDGYIKKPYRMRDLSQALRVIYDLVTSGTTSRPKPERLILLG